MSEPQLRYYGPTQAKEQVTKLNAARRQLDEAIAMFFRGADAIAVHTLAAASAQILCDLCRSRGIGRRIRDGVDTVRPELRKEWVQAVKQSENFFKHADRDPDEVHEFNPMTTLFFMFDATQMFAQMANGMSHEMTVYNAWFLLCCPDALLDNEAKTRLVEASTTAGADPKNLEFFSDVIKMKSTLSPSSRVQFL